MKKSHVLTAIFLATTILSGTARAAGLIWTNSSGNFATASNWSPAQSPAVGDGTIFTNDTSYTVTFTASTPLMLTNDFNGHAGTVTLDIGAGNSWTLTNTSTGAGNAGLVVGQNANATATVFMISGSLNVTSTTAGANIKIGGNGQGTFTVTNGTVRNNTTVVGDTATGQGTLTITGPNTVWTNGGTSATFNVGSVSSGNSLTISNGAQLITGNASIGFNATSTTNKVLITDANSTWLSSGNINFGGASAFNSLTISNGGQLLSNTGTIGNAAGASNNTVVITGSNSLWSNNTVNIGLSTANQLTIANGGKMISNVGTIGSSVGGSNNVVVLSGSGSTWSNTATLTIGGVANLNNSLSVSNGAALYAGVLFAGGNAATKSNFFNLGGLGAASSLTVTGNFQVGNNSAASFGYLTITNATVNSGTFNIGGGAGSNHTTTVLAGTTWNLTGKRFAAVGFIEAMTVDSAVITNAGDFIWGNNSSFNTLVLTNGSKLFTGVAGSIWDVGRIAAARSNVVIVTGNGSTWDAGSRIVTIGDAQTSNNTVAVTNNVITVAAGGVFTNGSLLVGNGNVLAVTTNSVTINNTLLIGGGKIAVSNLQVTATNTVTVNAGTLNTGGTAISSLANNGAALVIGDGVNAASLELAAGGTGFHTFGSGLVITNNATLAGVGTIIGNTTILGTLAPGFSPGTITTSNDVTIGNSAVMNYDLAAPGSSDLTAVNGNLTLGGTLNLTDAGGFTNGTYTLFTYTGALTYNSPSIGTTPNAGLYYAIDTGTVGQVKLQVTYTAPAGPITGSTSVNTGDSGVTYSISGVPLATTYTWTVPAGASVATGQGTTSITVNYGCSAVSGNVTVTPSNGGGSGASSSLGVTVTGVGAAGGITGSASVNTGDSGVSYSISSVSGATTYTWTVPIGATVASGQGTASITVDYSCSAVSGNVSVTPANANACPGSSSSLGITVTGVGAAGTISGTGTVNTGDSGDTYSISAVSGATTYAWTVPIGATVASGQGTTSITVDYSCSVVSGNVSVTPANANGCVGTANSLAITVTGVDPAGSITGPSAVNGGDSGVGYSISAVSGATTYTWTAPAGAVVSSGQGTTNITIHYLCGSPGGNVTVTPRNANSCSGTSSSLAVTVSNVGAAGSISGAPSVNTGDSGVAYSISAVSGATTYTWTAPTGATIASGQGTTSITVDYSCSAVSGNVGVTPANANGCMGTANSLAITVTGVDPAGSITGPSFVNANDTGVAYSIASVNGATTYAWTVPAGASVASGQGTTNITVNWASTSGNVTVTPSNANACTGASSSLPVTVVDSSVLRITAVARQGDDFQITWLTIGGTTNIVQVTPGDGNGSYNTNSFTDIAGSQTIIPGTGPFTTNYTESGGATNVPSRYYRIRLVP